MARKNRTPEENARREKIRELLQMANIGSMEEIQSLFKETIAEFMENGLEAEWRFGAPYQYFRRINRKRTGNFYVCEAIPIFKSSTKCFVLKNGDLHGRMAI